jgi:hypothetical protein
MHSLLSLFYHHGTISRCSTCYIHDGATANLFLSPNVGLSFGYLIPATTVLKNPLRVIPQLIIRRQMGFGGGRRPAGT